MSNEKMREDFDLWWNTENKYGINSFGKPHAWAAWQAALAQQPQGNEVTDAQRLLRAAREVLSWTEIADRPPRRDAIECGRSAQVRVHALADLHDAVTAIQKETK